MYENIFTVLDRLVSGSGIKSAADQFYAHDRFFTFPRFHQTAAICAKGYRQAEIEQVEIVKTPADGKTTVHDYIMPKGWDAASAELSLIDPETSQRKLLASYQDCPHVLFNYSARTPDAGLEADLVYVPDLTRLSEKITPGCVVLIHDRTDRKIEKLLAEKGALGVICDWRDNILSTPDAHVWENYAFYPDNPFNLFGFSVDKATSDILIENCGKSKIHVRINSRSYDDEIDLVSAAIPGTGNEEVIACGHLFEPGAWDNASGAAVIQEAARILNKAISEGKLERPKRTIRFLSGFECYGLAVYLANHPDHRKITAGINVDGVGVDMFANQAPLCHFLNPASNPSFTDNLLDYILEKRLPLGNPKQQAKGMAKGEPVWFTDFPLTWRNVPFGGCDSFPADPYFDIPFPGLVQFSGKIWHNSKDVPDKLVPEVLAEFALITAAYLYILADAGERDALNLAKLIQLDFEHRIHRLELDGSVLRNLSRENLEFMFMQHEKSLKSLYKITDMPGDGNAVKVILSNYAKRNKTLCSRIVESLPVKKKSQLNPDLKRQAETMIPKRRTPGILTLETLDKNARYNCDWGPGYQVLINQLMWVDGKRSLLEIWRLLEQETGRTELRELINQFIFLEKHKYITISRSGIKNKSSLSCEEAVI